ncbi:MAG TPA: SDR family oxidoreductase [Candidatus Binatia bacterium]|nr:SDR family oxidoreductase [Candidatus Binatia bacterium]
MSRPSPETVLVTGASSGIGLELARCFAAEKSNLVLVARNTAALEQLAAELRDKFSVEVRVLTADLAKPESPPQIFEELGRGGAVVDVLVNNAGFGLHGAFAELPLNRQLEMVQVNVMALTNLTGLFLPGMIQRGRGGILNVGSVAGFLPGPNMAVYYATKAFVMSFSEALREELRDSGVTVTDLCPGPTATNFSQVARSHRTRKVHYGKMSAAEVARIGHVEFRRGKVLSIPGVKNKMMTFLPRMIGRRSIARLSGHYNKLD